MKLTGRLEEIVRWVPECERVIDVGTDHALVPIALLSRVSFGVPLVSTRVRCR